MKKSQKMKENKMRLKLNKIELAAYNTYSYAPSFLRDYIDKFKNSNFNVKDWNTFIIWLQTVVPENIKFELLDEQHLIFKGAIEQNALSTNPKDLLTKNN